MQGTIVRRLKKLGKVWKMAGWVPHELSDKNKDYRLHAAIQTKRPRKKNHIVFHHDNAKPHVEHRVFESIEDKGWDLLPHPPYSPTEAPSDYHVNRLLKNWMVGKVYDDLNELVDDVKAWIASKNKAFFARGIDMLPEKWEAVIEVDGEYAPE
uniref:Transposase n=1 Tax=Acrobeloides nanus TaxID=290746 RepID=A0A914D4J8_9BILA